MEIRSKILFLTVFRILSTVYASSEEDTQVNQIEVAPESTDRNARYVKLSYVPTPYPNYNNYPNIYYPSNVYYPTSSRYPSTTYYPDGTTNFYPSNNYPGYPERSPGNYPSKLDPSYWLNKIPFPTNSNNPNYPNNYPNQYYPNQNYPNPNYPYPNYPNYPRPPTTYYPEYPTGTNFIGRRYPGEGGYLNYLGYPGYGNGGYGGYQGNGGLGTYSGYDGYYASRNRPGNVGYGYQNSRSPDNFLPSSRYPLTNPSIVTPSTVSKDAK